MNPVRNSKIQSSSLKDVRLRKSRHKISNGVKSEIDLLIEEAKREEEYFKNYLYYAELIKKEAEKLLGKVKVFVFGSILRKDEISRDIDILIISPKLKTAVKKSKIRIKIQEKIEFFTPFEIHLITPEEYKNWYSHFIKEKIEIK